MSYYGFWYRRKVVSGQLKLARSNHKKNMCIIERYAEKITDVINAIEYPKDDYNWDTIREKIDTVAVPKLKDSKKTHILVIVPWMMLGGADKFNLDLFDLNSLLSIISLK